MAVYILFTIACVLPTLVSGFSTGAGDQACISLIPNHGTTSQNSTPPYILVVDTTSIKQGGVVTVTLNASATLNATTAGTFKGFLVQARCTLCSTGDTAIVPGTFAKYTASDDTIQTKTCVGGDKNSITHTTAVDKKSVMFTWRAPSDYDASQGIQFRAAVVQTRPIWWNTIVSDEISVTADNSASTQSALGMVVVIASVTMSLLL